MTNLLPLVTTALSVGIGCGSCCSPFVSAFLSTYVLSHADGMREGAWAYAAFFLGKLCSVCGLCALASVIGAQFMGYIGAIPLRLAVQICLSAIGVYMILRWVRTHSHAHKSHTCAYCTPFTWRRGALPVFVSGFVYGLTPCAPLLMILGMALTCSLPQAALTGGIFTLSTMLSPLLLIALFTGVLSARLRREIAGFVHWFQLASYACLAVMPFFIQA